MKDYIDISNIVSCFLIGEITSEYIYTMYFAPENATIRSLVFSEIYNENDYNKIIFAHLVQSGIVDDIYHILEDQS
jgi:hypothetical protein